MQTRQRSINDSSLPVTNYAFDKLASSIRNRGMASPMQTARAIYSALSSNTTAEAKIRQELEDLALSLAMEPEKSFELTSSTVNGQTFSGSRTMTNHDRLQILTLVVAMYDKNGPITSSVTPLF